MRAVDVGFFEHLCEELIDEVARSGEPIAISRNGAPIAELSPVSTGRRGLLGLHEGQIEILGDIITPLDVEWDADR